jgi:hypothetical protein
MDVPLSRKKRIGGIIGAITAVLTFILVQQLFFNPPSIDKVMMHAASELNKTCPFMVDRDTRLDNAVAFPGNIFQYNYTLVNWVKDSIDPQNLQDYLEPILVNSIRTNPGLKLYRDNKTTMSYSYRDKNGVFVFKIDITPQKYQ